MLNSEDRKVVQEALDDWHRSDYVDALLAIIDRLTTTTPTTGEPSAPGQPHEDTARLDYIEQVQSAFSDEESWTFDALISEHMGGTTVKTGRLRSAIDAAMAAHQEGQTDNG